MVQQTRKLLSILLILLLGLSPLQSAMAELSAPVDTTTMPCHMADTQTDIIPLISLSTDVCEMCVDNSDCNNTCCSHAQCTPNVVALLQGISSLIRHPSSLALLQVNENITKNSPLALFRPPRV